MSVIFFKTLIYAMFLSFTQPKDNHPIYISNTEIKYNNKSESYEISVKIFADDLEKVFKKQYKEEIELGTDRENPKAKEYLTSYLKKNLIFYIDNKQLDYKYIGHESGEKSEMFAMYVYLESKKCNKSIVLKVSNSILLSELNNQLNFISLHTNSGVKKYICRKGDSVKLLN
jgi:hypothetical protein